jgi:4-amino-4-deoxy-L-arabinose transferase-like glycosyltransferase
MNRLKVETVVELSIFLAIVCAVRAPSFTWSVINWDESIYVLISRSLLDGNILYVDIWDHKQPLLFALFALSLLVFGKTILAIRLLACGAVATTCFLLYRIGRKTLAEDRFGPFAAAGLYAIFTMSSGGMATNAEILFAPFVVAAVGLILPWWVSGASVAPPSAWRCFAVGVTLGLGTFTKLIVVYEAAFVVLLLIAGFLRGCRNHDLRLSIGWFTGRSAILITGVSLPWALGIIYFSYSNALGEFVFSNFTFNLMYMAEQSPLSLHTMWMVAQRQILAESGLLWLGLVIGIGLLVINPPSLTRSHRRLLVALIVWVAIATVAAVSLRRPFLHYYLQVYPPLSLVCGFAIVWMWRRSARVPVLLRFAFVAVLLVPQGLRIAEQWRHIGDKVDVSAAVAEYIGARAQPGEYIYVTNYQPIIYFVTDTRVPTRWAFPPHFVEPEYRSRLGIDLHEEMASIFAHRPAYVVVETRQEPTFDPAYDRLLHAEYLDQDYKLAWYISTIAIYRRLESVDEPGQAAGPEIGPIKGSHGDSTEQL